MKEYREMREAIKFAMAMAQGGASRPSVLQARVTASNLAHKAGYELFWKEIGNPLPKIKLNGADVTASVIGNKPNSDVEVMAAYIESHEMDHFKCGLDHKIKMAMNTLLDVFPEHPKELLAVVALEHVAKEMDIWSTDHKKKFRSVLR